MDDKEKGGKSGKKYTVDQSDQRKKDTLMFSLS